MSQHSTQAHAARFAPPAALIDGKRNLVGMDMDELKAALKERGVEAFRAKQIWSWIYCHGVRDLNAMTNLAKPVREKLAEHFTVGRPEITADQKSEDGTRKWLIKMADGQQVESVHIPEEDRGALCVSSQVGCTLTCRVCHTGTQKLVRNLDASEIIMQVMQARDSLGEWPSTKENRMLSNIVMMGMGEPLYNYDNVAKALKIIMDSDGIAIGKRRITLSTSGVVPMIARCGSELGVNLAISLHAVTDELRDQIVPINRKYPIRELLNACRNYPGLTNARRITFEYVMLKGVNDTPADARALVKLLSGIPAKINLIPFNAWPGSPFECSDWDTIQKFGDLVNHAGYASPVRTPRGRDIMAACGQLKSDSLRLTAKERAAIDIVIAEKEVAQGLTI
jgi:23S rRNA (adenine2503-C2)-methyltransferase